MPPFDELKATLRRLVGLSTGLRMTGLTMMAEDGRGWEGWKRHLETINKFWLRYASVDKADGAT